MPWGAEGRRRRRALKPFDYPGEVVHALDYFIWAALDEHLAPTLESRPFTDDERHYNAILNRYFGHDLPSTAEATMPRMSPGPGGRLVPNYFPDGEINTLEAAAKDLRVLNQFDYRQSRLDRVSEFGNDPEGVGAKMPTERWVLINPGAYKGYFQLIREDGVRFAEATHEHREVVTMTAAMAAVIAAGTDDESRFLFPFPDGWKALDPTIAQGVIPDALDPEALVI